MQPPQPSPPATTETKAAKPKKEKKACHFAEEDVANHEGDSEKAANITVEEKKRRSQRVSTRSHVAAITKEDFSHWTTSCGVFKIQKEYELIAADARDKGITIEAEMKDRNFKDYNHFARSCERFPLTCWPGVLSELGSGFVLYFHFLGFLMILYMVISLVQIPAIMYYSDHDNAAAWWHEGKDKNSQESAPADYYVSKMFLTPGNLGPDLGDNNAVLVSYYLALTPLLCLLFVAQFQHQKMTEAWVDADTTSPNDFAILVKGLPTTATDERAIMEFFRAHAISGKTGTEVVKVVIGWDADDFRGRIKKIEGLKEQLKKADANSQEAASLKERIAEINSNLAAGASQQAARLKSSGTVVVIFRSQSDMRACLARWSGFWARRFYCEAEDVGWLPRGNSMRRGAALPRFPGNEDDEDDSPRRLQVRRAPNPGDINWMKLGVSAGKKYKQIAKTNLVMLVMIVACFWAVWGLEQLQRKQEDETEGKSGEDWVGSRTLSFLPGLGVTIVNMLLSWAAREFGDREPHDTLTEKESSVALKMCIGMIINTSGVLMFTHSKSAEWYARGGLIDDVSWVMIMDGVLGPLWLFFDIGWILNSCARRQVTEDRLERWTDKITQNAPPKTKENFEELKTVKEEVFEAKLAFEPDEADSAGQFASAINSFICCMIFTPVLPALPFIGLLGVLVQYWVDKLLLLRWQKRPRPQNASMAVWSLKMLKHVAPTCWSLSVFYYLTPSWQDKTKSFFYFTISLVTSLVVSIVPLAVWTELICCDCCLVKRKGLRLLDESFDDYYNAQHMWSREMKYHKDQFLYKSLSDEQNPEMLSPDTDTALDVDSYKDSYGTAVAQVAATAGEKSPKPVAMPGGKVIGGPSYASAGWGQGQTAYPWSWGWGYSCQQTAPQAGYCYGGFGHQGQVPAAQAAPATYGVPTSTSATPMRQQNGIVPAIPGQGQGFAAPERGTCGAPLGQGYTAQTQSGVHVAPGQTSGCQTLGPAGTHAMPGQGMGYSAPGHAGGYAAPSAGSVYAAPHSGAAHVDQGGLGRGTTPNGFGVAPVSYGGVQTPSAGAPLGSFSYGSGQAAAVAPYGNYGTRATAPLSAAPAAACPQGSWGVAPVAATSQVAPKAYGWPAANAPQPRGSSPSVPGFSWEFESKGGFAGFAWENQADLESKYQAFLAGRGHACVSVDVAGTPVSVDFKKMTQKAPRGKVRKVRRRETDKE